ncbi:MAG TPA: Gfo/Idh/MocA family oxidoreductase, partial [Pirellulales bacterium]|nr:Gfo/Idh/MocA family oxidoreductase [Pirellulales bacterium]
MTKSRGVGFGIVGCGMIAGFHARAIADIRGARVAACFDAVPAAADRFAAAQGCRAYHSLKEMLADPDVDVVTVGTPSGAHLEPAVAAARAGKHVIVEKPLEITLRRCDQIIRECESH